MAKLKVGSFRDAGFDADDEEGVVALALPSLGPVTIQFYEDTVVGAYSMSVHGSIDGTNWSVINAAVTTETFFPIEVPPPYLKVIMDSEPATSGTVYALASWFYTAGK